jgi:hypothetical protein
MILIPLSLASSLIDMIDKEVNGVVLSLLRVGIIYRKEAFSHGPKQSYPATAG